MKTSRFEKVLGQGIRPELLCLVVVRKPDGRPNVMPACWFMRASFDPPLLAVSIGGPRYTHSLIPKAKEFVLAIPSERMVRLIDPTGFCSGRDTDKIRKFKIRTRPGRRVRTPVLADAKINFECRLAGKSKAGDHTIYLGEVLGVQWGRGKHSLLHVGGLKYRPCRTAS